MENLANNLRKIKNDFATIGARVQVVPYTSGSDLFRAGVAQVSVVEDMIGEFFEITISRDIIDNLRVIKIDRESNSLVLAASTEELFVCGARDRDLSIEYIFSPESVKTIQRYDSEQINPASRKSPYLLSFDLSALYGRKAAMVRNQVN